jgi:hypothetical protein
MGSKRGIDESGAPLAYYPHVVVPNGVRLYFFVDEGAPLPVDQGWIIYRALMKKYKTVEDYENIQKLPGFREHTEPTVLNYIITGDASWVDSETKLKASGIFVMGDEEHKDLRTHYIFPAAQEPAHQFYSTLSFFTDGRRKWMPRDEVYWVTCRSYGNPT